MNSKKNKFIGLKSGESIEKAYNNLALKKKITKISDIKMPLVIPTVDLNDSKEYIFTNYTPQSAKSNSSNSIAYITDISVGKAVRASSSFPAIFCPCEYKNHKFLDGGVLDNIPVNEVKKQGATKVIAVNFKADDIDEKSNVMDIGMRTIDIMGNKISEENLKMSDYILTIQTDKTGLLDTKKLDSCYKYGYNQTIEQLDKIKEVLSGREQDIIRKRYGIGGFKIKTQREIAAEYGISRSYISRIEKSALLKLRKSYENDCL